MRWRFVHAVGIALIAGTGAPALGGFARGAVRIDVRDARGHPIAAPVELRGADGMVHKAARVGEVYVAEGLVAGDYTLEVDAGGGEWLGARKVHVRERRIAGVVAVISTGRGGQGRAGRRSVAGLMSGDEAGCDESRGVVIDALAFARGLPAAGRLELRAASGRARGKLVCTIAVAGGTADLKLLPGDYNLSATFVGGGATQLFYRILDGKPPPPLALRVP